MRLTFADFEFHTQDRNATRRTNAPQESHPTDGDRRRLEVLAEIVRQGTRRQVFSNLCCGLKVQLGMNMLAETNLHHGCQFAPNLGSRTQRNREDALSLEVSHLLKFSALPFRQDSCSGMKVRLIPPRSARRIKRLREPGWEVSPKGSLLSTCRVSGSPSCCQARTTKRLTPIIQPLVVAFRVISIFYEVLHGLLVCRSAYKLEKNG
jgi:hypothetical protein